MRDFYILIGNCKATWTYVGIIYCLNTNEIWMMEWRGGQSQLWVNGSGAVVADNRVPNTFFELHAGATACLRDWIIEGAPGYTIGLNPYGNAPSGHAPAFFSVADLKNLYDGDYDYGWGCRIFVT